MLVLSILYTTAFAAKGGGGRNAGGNTGTTGGTDASLSGAVSREACGVFVDVNGYLLSTDLLGIKGHL